MFEEVPDPVLEGGAVVRMEAAGGGRILYTNSLGQLETRIFLESRLGPGSGGLSAGWDGDLYALIEGPSGERGLVWVIGWDDAESRDRFVSAVAGELAQLHSTHRLEALEVDGVPAALVQLGEVPLPEVSMDPWGEVGR